MISCRRIIRGGGAGFTLIEVLVVVGILAVVLALLIPAVQSAREAARKTQCRSNLREIALGCRSHESLHGFLPYPGWSAGHVGDPDLGFTRQQPGGWLYSVLPYVDQVSLYELGAGLSGNSAAELAAHAKRISTVVPLYVCPSRGSAVFTRLSGYNNAAPPTSAARSDYAGCWAATNWSGSGALDTLNHRTASREFAEITDGLGNVFLCGERYLAPEEYIPSATLVECNDRGWSVGFEGDIYSSVINSAGGDNAPLRDTPGTSRCWRYPTAPFGPDQRYAGGFGGPHDVVHMAMCDGSVRPIVFEISPALFRQMGVIDDGAGRVEDLP